MDNGDVVFHVDFLRSLMPRLKLYEMIVNFPEYVNGSC
jgi:hypothetical protein